MNVLFDLTHPAHVHLFKNAIDELKERGHETAITSREKDVATTLLDAYGFDHDVLSAHTGGPLSPYPEWVYREYRLAQVARKVRPDVMVGRVNPAIAHVSRLVGCRNVLFKDSSYKTPIGYVTYPFSDRVVTPEAIDLGLDGKQVRLGGFQELAYLHPARFQPDREPLERAGVDPDEPFFVLRFSDWSAYHDRGKAGFSRDGKRKLVDFLSAHGTVYVSSEDDLPATLSGHDLPVDPQHVHDLLSYADCYVGDSGTMATEASLLGTPAVRVCSIGGDADLANFRRLEEEYGLLYSLSDETQAMEVIRELVTNPETDEIWNERLEDALEDAGDVTDAMVEIILESATGGERT
ncbi:DUF354 domain-containing protein [Natrialbaceae archaeon A-gly3]